MLAQRVENKGVELTGGGGNAGRRAEGPSGRWFSNCEDFGDRARGVKLVLESPNHRQVEKSKAPGANAAPGPPGRTRQIISEFTVNRKGIRNGHKSSLPT